MGDFVARLLQEPAFYTAMLALVHAVLFYVAPAFPREIVVAFDGLVTVIASVWCGKAVEAKRNAATIAELRGRIAQFTRPA